MNNRGKWGAIPGLLFYSNYFYGLCAVALSVEASLQQRYPLNPWYYYIFIFISTVLYYSFPYVGKFVPGNDRSAWYRKNHLFMRSNQVMLAVLVLFAMVLFSFKFRDNLEVTTADQLALFLVFPFAAFGYYTFLRNIGWLKPFLVAFTGNPDSREWLGFFICFCRSGVLAYNY